MISDKVELDGARLIGWPLNKARRASERVSVKVTRSLASFFHESSLVLEPQRNPR